MMRGVMGQQNSCKTAVVCTAIDVVSVSCMHNVIGIPLNFVGRCLATKVLQANCQLPECTGQANDERGSQTNKIVEDLNWGAFDYASHAPQLRSCNYHIQCMFTAAATQHNQLWHANALWIIIKATYYIMYPCKLQYTTQITLANNYPLSVCLPIQAFSLYSSTQVLI